MKTEEIFKNIYERNYRRSFLFVKSFVHDDLTAEDIVADSLIKFWEYRKKSQENVSEAILLTILKNASIDYLRREMNRMHAIEKVQTLAVRELELQISSLEACNPNEIFTTEIKQIVRDTLNQLPERTRIIFMKSRFLNKSLKQIAEDQNLTTKAVEYHITKALKALRITLKDYLPLFFFFLD